MENKFVGDKFVAYKKIGKGSFGEVYEGAEVKSRNKVAVKFDFGATNELHTEYLMYLKLAGTSGIPIVYWYGSVGEFNALVMQLLGETLYAKMTREKGYMLPLPKEKVLLLARKMLAILEKVHGIGIRHNDIKLDNIVYGPSDTSDDVYIIDFGMSQETGSFKEDMLDLGYVLLSCFHGKIFMRCLRGRIEDDVKELCKGLHQGIQKYFEYCLNMKDDEIASFNCVKHFFEN